jgi:Flagellar transcriptional activator (FlhC)
MRISEARYSRDRLRFDLALRFIRHEARTSTIREWTGLSDDRIRKLFRAYMNGDAATLARHRGRSPRQSAFFLRTQPVRREAALLASVCYLLGVVPGHRVADAQRDLPDVHRGEALCDAYETYQRLVPTPRISFEHAVYLVAALSVGVEIRAARCSHCQSLVIVEAFRLNAPCCPDCPSREDDSGG